MKNLRTIFTSLILAVSTSGASHSNEAEKIVREMYNHFLKGDQEATYVYVSADLAWIEPGPPEVLPWAGTYLGIEGFKEFNVRLSQALSSVVMKDLEFIGLGADRVLVLGTEQGVVASTGSPYETHSAWIWTVKRGKVVHMRAIHDTYAMVLAVQAP